MCFTLAIIGAQHTCSVWKVDLTESRGIDLRVLEDDDAVTVSTLSTGVSKCPKACLHGEVEQTLKQRLNVQHE